MPWHTGKSDQCPASKPWAVIKDSDGTVEGCHATKEAARKQLAALYANESGRASMRERRMIPSEIRAVENGDGHEIILHCIKPGIVDDYGSMWDPHTFDESIEERMPTLVWSHDWSEPLGPGIDYELGDEGPEIRFGLDDFDAVPMARRAWVQTRSGTIRDCSVGFSNTKRRDPTDEEREAHPDIKEYIHKATLDEVSLVLRGAVPGAKVLSVRDGETVPKPVVARLMARLGAGEIDLADALTELKVYSEPGEEAPPPEPKVETISDDESEALEAEVAEVYDALIDRAKGGDRRMTPNEPNGPDQPPPPPDQ
jgi:HK97 family phage prohead protease